MLDQRIKSMNGQAYGSHRILSLFKLLNAAGDTVTSALEYRFLQMTDYQWTPEA
jgi:hypothetical protein